MRWLCWFVPHKWIDCIAPEYQQCERCPKTRLKPRKPDALPHGALHCPYLDCIGWVTAPSRDGYNHTAWTKCRSCRGHVRWERRWTIDGWDAPKVVG